MEEITAQKSAFEWVQHAHRAYISSRILFQNYIPFESVLLGAHALEIYLKAFIIHKTGKYKPGHKLSLLYKKCKKLDSYFEDEQLSKYFIVQKSSNTPMPELWDNYLLALRYPESLQQPSSPIGFIVHMGSDTAGTFESLDRIAYFMYKNIHPSDNVISFQQNLVTEQKAINPTEIDDFLNGDGYYGELATHDNYSQLKDLFLRNNKYFNLPEE